MQEDWLTEGEATQGRARRKTGARLVLALEAQRVHALEDPQIDARGRFCFREGRIWDGGRACQPVVEFECVEPPVPVRTSEK